MSGSGRSRRGIGAAAVLAAEARRSPAKAYRSTGAPPGPPDPKNFKAADLPRIPFGQDRTTRFIGA